MGNPSQSYGIFLRNFYRTTEFYNGRTAKRQRKNGNGMVETGHERVYSALQTHSWCGEARYVPPKKPIPSPRFSSFRASTYCITGHPIENPGYALGFAILCFN